MVGAFVTGSRGPSSSLVIVSDVLSGKTLDAHSASIPPGVKMGTDEHNAGGNPAMEKHP